MRASFELDEQRIEVCRAPVEHVVVDGLFGEALSAAILEHIIALEPHFAPAGIGRDSEQHPLRQNLTCGPDALFFTPGDEEVELEERFRRRAQRSVLLGAIDSLMLDTELREVFDGAPFPLCKLREVDRWETQVSRYGAAGDEYRWHYDRLGDDGRLVSIVYYVFSEPRAFEGGELELTRGLVRRGALISSGTETARVVPAHDRAVIFDARTAHRVLPTKAPDEFGAGRFSVNVFAGITSEPPAGQVY